MKLTEDIELGEESDAGQQPFLLSHCLPDIKQQILENQEKAEKWDKLDKIYLEGLSWGEIIKENKQLKKIISYEEKK